MNVLDAVETFLDVRPAEVIVVGQARPLLVVISGTDEPTTEVYAGGAA